MYRRIVTAGLFAVVIVALVGCGSIPGDNGATPTLWTLEFSSASQDVREHVRSVSLFESAEGLTLRFAFARADQDDADQAAVRIIYPHEAFPSYEGPAVTRVAVLLRNPAPLDQVEVEPATFDHEFAAGARIDRDLGGAVVVDLREDADVRLETEPGRLDVILINCARNDCPPRFEREQRRN